ncbi:MAG: hypothetical protein ABSF99_07010 [Anaerolineales bacterium]
MYGNTLILEGIRASLENFPGLEVLSLDASRDESFEELQRLDPAAIIFDMGGVSADFPLAILQQPNLLLIGIDPATDRMLLWSGEKSHALSMQDLVQAIDVSGGESHPPVTRSWFRDPLRRLTSWRTARVFTRKQKLAFALVGLALVVVLGVALLPVGRLGNAPLAGTAIGRLPVEVGLAFAAGLLLGGLVLALWLRRRR